MSEAAPQAKTCKRCDRDFNRFFVYCPSCSEKLTFKAEPVAPPPVVPQVTGQARPPTLPPIAAKPAANGTVSPRETKPAEPAAVARAPALRALWSRLPALLKIGLPVAVVAAVLAGALSFPGSAKNLEVQVDDGHWQTVDLATHFGHGVPFVVTADAPLRLRSGSGKPITTATGPVSLGEITDGRIEVRSVRGSARISFAQR